MSTHRTTPVPAAPSGPSAAGARALLVVTIDRLPAWMIGACGATWVATPVLDTLASRGIVLDRLITPSTAVADTLRDLMAGRAPEGPTLLESARDAGLRPLLVTDDAAMAASLAVAGPATPLAEVRVVAAAAAVEVATEDAQTNVGRLVEATRAAILSGSHRLVWCHVGSLGVAWDAPERYRARYVDPDDPPPPPGAAVPAFRVDAGTDPDRVVGCRQVYAGQISLLDGQLGRLFEAVQGPAAAGRWSVAVVGVRGLPLGLHGQVGSGGPQLPYGELVHVPAIVADADGRMAGQRFGGLVTPADVGALLPDLVWQGSSGEAAGADGLDPARPWRGASLAGLFVDWSAPVRDRVVVTSPDGVAIVTPCWHAVLPGGDAAAEGSAAPGVRLFAKPDDYFEQSDVGDRSREVAECLAGVARRATGVDPHQAWLVPIPPPA